MRLSSDAGCRDRACPPLAFIIGDEVAICRIIAMTLDELGIDSRSFRAAQPAIAAFTAGLPDLIFLDLALASSGAVHVIEGLGGTGFGGAIQLISGGNPLVIETIQRIGTRRGLTFLPTLRKPFGRGAIRAIVASVRLDAPASRTLH